MLSLSRSALAARPVPAMPLESGVCRHCGGHLALPKVVGVDLAEYDEERGFSYDGHRIHLAGAQRRIVAALLAAKGRIVTTGVLIDRMGTEGDAPLKTLRVQVANIRRVLAAIGAPSHLRTERGLGYRWQA